MEAHTQECAAGSGIKWTKAVHTGDIVNQAQSPTPKHATTQRLGLRKEELCAPSSRTHMQQQHLL